MKKGWFGGGLWKPKNPHSLEQLRYLFSILTKNQSLHENNRSLLVESLRSIAEILIWGDQNDSSVFDFFLEKNMLSFFIRIMRQNCGSYVCVQLLQTLNILFENIRNETSLYYLLSNNHVNSIIVHKFDFSDEEVMAYYISFIKTLSLKLNIHTIHFFYNEHTNDFPLYTEAIKFFNHPENMVRIAVRTLTLNVYKVDDRSMRQFIRDKTAVPYFTNMVWFIGNHILELDSCLRADVDHCSKDKLSNLVAEHLDHLHYLNDIFRLNISELNVVLSHHLLNRLLVPLLIYSLNCSNLQEGKPRVSRIVALLLLSQIFLIFSFSPLMLVLSKLLLHGDSSIFSKQSDLEKPAFVAPEEPLEKSLRNSESTSEKDDSSNVSSSLELSAGNNPITVSAEETSLMAATHVNMTDEEKEPLMSFNFQLPIVSPQSCKMENLSSRPFLMSILEGLDCSENDYTALFSLSVLYALGHNPGINKNLLAISLGLMENGKVNFYYCPKLIQYLLKIVSQSTQIHSKIRIVTLEMCLNVLKTFFQFSTSSSTEESESYNRDHQLAAMEGAKEEATLLLRNYYKGEEVFLDMFEDEWRELNKGSMNVEYLLQDASILLPPTGTPLTGIDFHKRLPCGEVEKTRRSMRVYFLIRAMCLFLKNEVDSQLPLTNSATCVQESDVLDLNNSDLIACVVITRDNQRLRRFLVIDVIQLILVEPDQRRLGWGVAKFVGFLQNLEVMGDKDDSRVLHITIHRPSVATIKSAGRPTAPLLAAKFIFDDHIRCMAAKQRLTKGRIKARQRKLHQIAKILDMPGNLQPCPSPPLPVLNTMMHDTQRRSSQRSSSENRSRNYSQRHKYFTQTAKGPGVALKRESTSGAKSESGSDSSLRASSQTVSRSSSRTRNEEIPLDDLSSASSYKGSDFSRNSSSSIIVPCTAPSKMKTQYVNITPTTVTMLSVAEQVPYRTNVSATERFWADRNNSSGESTSVKSNPKKQSVNEDVNNCDNLSVYSSDTDSSQKAKLKPAKKN